MKPSPLFAIASCSLCVMGSLQGANLLVNPSFEQLSGDYRYVAGANTTEIPGWTTLLNGVEIVTATDIGAGFPYPSTIQDGVQMLDLAPFTFLGGGIQQTFATTPGVTYDVSFFASSVNSFGKNGTGSVLVTVGSAVALFELNTPGGDFDWKSYGLSFVATGPSASLNFISLSDPFTQFSAIDNVSVTAVPEPVAAGAVAGIALAAFGTLRRTIRRDRSSRS